MTKKILITGAAGFTGLHACQYFSKKKYHVIGVARKQISDQKWQMEACDLLDKERVYCLFKKHRPDYCLHLAGVNSVAQSWSEPLSAVNINVIGTLHLLEAIRQFSPDCKVVVTGSALSQSDHPYAVSKFFQQKLSLEWGRLFNLSIIVAKPSNLIGPGPSAGIVSVLAERIVKMEKDKKIEPISISHLENKREFLDVRDAVAAYEILLNKGTIHSTYEIGSGHMNTLDEVTRIYQSLTELELTFLSVNANAENPPDLMNAKKVKELDWQPQYALIESISHILSYFRVIH